MEKRAEIYSGHESFPCRYGWLPKLYEAIGRRPDILQDEDAAIVALGLGKNMVRSIRFWGVAFGVAESFAGGLRATEFGRRLLDPETGSDPYLEDAGSLWRLHWRLSTRAGLGAWNAAIVDNDDPRITRQRLVDKVQARAAGSRLPVSPATVAAHVDMFIRTYAAPATTAVALEDTLGSPFQELGVASAREAAGATEITIHRGRPTGMRASDMAFALADFWAGAGATERGLTFRSIMLDRGSPGVVLGFDEGSAYGLLSEVCAASGGAFALRDDGAGGVDMIASRRGPPAMLEELAWS